MGRFFRDPRQKITCYLNELLKGEVTLTVSSVNRARKSCLRRFQW